MRRAGRVPLGSRAARGVQLLPQHAGARGRGAAPHRPGGRALRRPQSLQLGASGRHQGAAFTLVGRLQWRSAEGTWNEWHALFDTGPNAQRSGWLSEDNGQYVFGFDAPAPPDLPQAAGLHAGAELRAGGQAWSVATVSTARVASAEGELPGLPDLAQDHQIVELRNPQGEVASWALAGGAQAARSWSIGHAVRLDELALQGLKDESTRQFQGRALSCPSCGASLAPTLESTQTLVCGQCKAVIDISQENARAAPSFLAPPRGAGGAQPGPGGAQRPGGELNHYAQAQGGATGAQPLIPLGSTGRLALGSPQPLPWQVVGYMERCELPEDPHDDTVFWREYLLYHRTEGFAFLVDSEDGWSWVRPISGAPKSLGGERVGVGRHHLPAEGQLCGQDHLGAGRVLLARAPRPAQATTPTTRAPAHRRRASSTANRPATRSPGRPAPRWRPARCAWPSVCRSRPRRSSSGTRGHFRLPLHAVDLLRAAVRGGPGVHHLALQPR